MKNNKELIVFTVLLCASFTFAECITLCEIPCEKVGEPCKASLPDPEDLTHYTDYTGVITSADAYRHCTTASHGTTSCSPGTTPTLFRFYCRLDPDPLNLKPLAGMTVPLYTLKTNDSLTGEECKPTADD